MKVHTHTHTHTQWWPLYLLLSNFSPGALQVLLYFLSTETGQL